MIKLTSEQVEQYLKQDERYGKKREGRWGIDGNDHCVEDAELNAARAIALEALVGKLVGALKSVPVYDSQGFYLKTLGKEALVFNVKNEALAAARELGITTESEAGGN